ncbi:MAG: class I SAM-dependent methyltransferase [Geminicoccaceae bacterium]
MDGTAVDGQRFAFGKNWHDFVEKQFSPERVSTSKRHLLDFLGVADLKGKTFLDIGCGSGLHSLAAWESGANKIISFDYDPDSVQSTKLLREHAGAPANWVLSEGSVLDVDFMAGIEQADIVYSWGVLHHTGDVWRAIENAATRVKPGGRFYIALYSADVHVDPPPEFWLDLKLRYNASSVLGKRMIELWYIWRYNLRRRIWNLPKLVRQIRTYNADRGMSFYTDVKDWVGGWPMQFCQDAEVTERVEAMGFRQTRIDTGKANTEFLFVRTA